MAGESRKAVKKRRRQTLCLRSIRFRLCDSRLRQRCGAWLLRHFCHQKWQRTLRNSLRIIKIGRCQPPTVNRLRVRGAREEKQERTRMTRKTGMTRKTRRIGIPVPPVSTIPPVSLVSPSFTGIFFNTHAHKGAPKTLRSLRFFKKTSARLSVFFQKIFCYLYIFNTRFSDHSCHPSHFFHCTHFTYLPHTYYYIRGRLLLLKKRNVKPMLNVIFAFWSKLPIIRELRKMAQKVPKFFAKKICRFQKSRYLCIRFQKITKAHEFWDRLRLKNFWNFFWKSLEVKKKSLPLQSALKDKRCEVPRTISRTICSLK